MIRAAVRFLVASPTVRRLGRILPRRLRKRVASTFAGSDVGRDRRMLALSEHVRERLVESEVGETAAWQKVRSWSDWEAFRDTRLAALRDALGPFPAATASPTVRTTRTLSCDGFHIDCLVFQSRPGLTVTANLYRPAEPAGSMPGILLCHSHHYPKTEDELQEMGATWARCGCTVLVMDQLCHGERRQHPFCSAADYRRRFPVSRQDYFSRYVAGIQLHLIGDSLIGWMVWDLMRGVDLLVDRPGVDRSRIILIGSVAGGGDAAAVTAALDRRIAAVVPFGFGRARSGSWESTRNIRLSVRDGFAPWLILGSLAPRRLIYAHEFAWSPASDPVWKRLLEIYALSGAPDHLAAIHGSGGVSGRSPDDSHCNNVGAVHRRRIYPLLHRWFGIPVPAGEYRVRRPTAELRCMTAELPEELRGEPVHRLAAELARKRLDAARRRLRKLDARARREALRRDLVRLLGDVHASAEPHVMSRTAERIVLDVETGVAVPMMLLKPEPRSATAPPVVIGVAQANGPRLYRRRADVVVELLRRGVAVCLPELRGTGDPGCDEDSRGRRSMATAVSSSELMLGQTLLGARLRDLRSVARFLKACPELDGSRVAIWGDSLAPPNPAGRDLAVPFDADPFPAPCEPLGGLLALLGGLFEEDLRAVYLRGGLTAYASLLESRSCYVPHDVIVPGILTVGDVCDLAAALAPLPLRMEALVDGLNRRATAEVLSSTFRPTRNAYREAGTPDRIMLEPEEQPAREAADWISTQLQSGPVGR